MSRRWIFSVAACCFAFAAPANAATFFHFRSDPGDYIGGGRTRDFTTDTGRFSASASPDRVSVSYNSFDFSSWWYLDFANRRGIQITPGNYEDATRFPFQSPVRPGLDASGEGRGCNRLTGRFIVWEAIYGPGGEVLSFAADFEQHCEGATPALWGSIRVNSDVPQDVPGPHAAAGRNRLVRQGDTVVLDGSRSSDNDGMIIGYLWRQVSGTPSQLDCTECVRASFVAPPVPAGGDDLVFELDVVDDQGRSSADTVTIHALNPGDPQSAIHFVSDPGDYIGQGRTWNFTQDDGEFIGTHSGNVVEIRFTYESWWTLDFANRHGFDLVPGNYEDATRYPFQSPNRPGLAVSGDGRGCNQLTGRFIVWEAQYGPTGQLMSFAADFEQHCEGAVPALRGAVRFNSAVPLLVSGPHAAAGTNRRATEGETVLLDGSRSTDPDGTIVQYEWRQLSGVPAQLDSPHEAMTTFAAPPVPLGGDDLVFELRVTDDQARSSTDQVTIHVSNPGDAQTVMHFVSDPGDYIGQGRTWHFTQDDGEFVATHSSNLVEVRFNSDSSWTLDFANRRGIDLAPGNYEDATRYPFQSPTRPGLSVSGDGRGCNRLTGRFIVWEVQYGPTGQLLTLAADFEQHCEASIPALHGAIRFNSAVPLVVTGPHAAAGSNQRVTEGDFVVLDGRHSSDPDGTIVQYDWRQVSGAPAQLESPHEAVTSFVAPPVPVGGDDLVFELMVTDDLARTSADWVTIHVASQHDPQFVIHYDSDPGDYIGLGRTWHMTLDDGQFGATRNAANGVSLSFNGTTWWYLDFSAPGRVRLQPGTTYLNAARYPFQRDDQPGLSVYGDGRGCNTLTGQFTVDDVVYGVGDTIDSFAATFEQHCEGAQPALHGTVLFNFSPP